MLKLTKTIPARTETLEILSVKRDWILMSKTFRGIRAKFSNRMDRCFWCEHVFEDEEAVALAITPKGNKSLCQACAAAAEESEE
jgi:hypothetical protein